MYIIGKTVKGELEIADKFESFTSAFIELQYYDSNYFITIIF